MRVLLAEDQLVVAQAIRASLIIEYKAVVDITNSGQEAVDLARHYDYDLMVLDLTLPDMDGLDVLRQVHGSGRATPMLVLSEVTDAQARVQALKAGADDVMTKPLDHEELCARLRAIVRRSKGHSASLLQLGPLRLNLDTHEVSVSGKPLHLTGKEYSILELLAMRRGLVLTKEQFLNHLYGGMDEPEIKIIDVFICKLRRKLADAGAPKLIGTVWGRGYTIRHGQAAPHLEPAEAHGSQSHLAMLPLAQACCTSLASFLRTESHQPSNDEPAVQEVELASA